MINLKQTKNINYPSFLTKLFHYKKKKRLTTSKVKAAKEQLLENYYCSEKRNKICSAEDIVLSHEPCQHLHSHIRFC